MDFFLRPYYHQKKDAPKYYKKTRRQRQNRAVEEIRVGIRFIDRRVIDRRVIDRRVIDRRVIGLGHPRNNFIRETHLYEYQFGRLYF
jgi:hypothetical protein